MQNTTSSVSEILTYTTLNTNSVSDKKNTNTKNKPQTKTIVEVRNLAQKLCDRLNNPERFKYYCKLVWQLPERKIMQNLELAENGRSPQRLFTWLCENDLANQKHG